MGRNIAALILLSFCVGSQSLDSQGQDYVAITNVSIIDVKAGVARSGMTVLVAGNRIAEAGQSGRVAVPERARVIDGTGRFLIPGLWDMHVHWYNKELLGLFTANGVTGVRQMFGFPVHLEWRRELEKGSLVGPRMALAS